MKARITFLALIIALLLALTLVWEKTQSIDPIEHGRFDSALRELRSLDRTINQDVLRARYQLIDSYLPVLKSYRRLGELEVIIARPLPYLSDEANGELYKSVELYRKSVTQKQDLIERFKYRSAELKELLNYLPGAGTGVALEARNERNIPLSERVNHVLQLSLLYNLTSDESYSPTIARQLDALAADCSSMRSTTLKRRVHTLETNIRRLLKVKPAVDHLLVEVFELPVIQHEEEVAAIYARGYTAAERTARSYRFGLYALCVGFFLTVTYSGYKLRRSAVALAIANASLERRVMERTGELASRNEEMRLVLDNVDQALFMVDESGRVARERSAAFGEWFPSAPSETFVWEIFSGNEQAIEWLRQGWEQLAEDFLPADVVLEQLPTDLSHHDRHYHLKYLPVEGKPGNLKVLMIVSDVTERRKLAQRNLEQQELGQIFRHILRDRAGFQDFFAESDRLVKETLESNDARQAMRAIHTLKGNSSMYGFTELTQVSGEIESILVDKNEVLDGACRERLSQTWKLFSERVQSLAEVSNARLELYESDLESLRNAITMGITQDRILRLLRDMGREPAQQRLTRVAEQARSLARRLGKPALTVHTQANDVRLDAEHWAPFWSAFIHVVRNAIDHGIESAEARLAAGKDSAGTIWISTTQVAGHVEVDIRDDGCGIDWNRVRTRAMELGMPFESEADLKDSLLIGGLSTKAVVTEYSGRGTGISACFNVCRQMGGTVSLQSDRGRGTRVTFRIPNDPMSSLRPKQGESNTATKRG